MNYLLRAPVETAHRYLNWLQAHHIPLTVGLPLLPADKHVCGDGVEGMIWPGEVELMASRLLALGAKVDFFGLDLPLTGGHLSADKRACHLPIRETALRLAAAVRRLQSFYPNSKIIDTEVPTGIPPDQWVSTLNEWLTDYREASGHNFYALILDIWWASPWQRPARDSIQILATRGVRSGIILNADGGNALPATTWVAAARLHGCQIRPLGFDIVEIANWFDMNVRNLPETDPASLAGLLLWFYNNNPCRG